MSKIKKGLSLQFLWDIRLKLRAEGDKLHAEGNNLHAEGNKLYAEGNNLHAEGRKLYAEGDILWAEAIIELHGNIKMEWKNYNKEKNDYECHLEASEVF